MAIGTVVFIHGGWVTPACWEPFASYFEANGYRCLTPAWPGKDRPVEAIREDPSALAGLGVDAIVDHYAEIVRSLDEPPVLVGHSFGGLFVQLLLDRGRGSAGIAIDSAPPKGIFNFEPTTLLSAAASSLSPSAGGRSSVGAIPSSGSRSSTRCRQHRPGRRPA